MHAVVELGTELLVAESGRENKLTHHLIAGSFSLSHSLSNLLHQHERNQFAEERLLLQIKKELASDVSAFTGMNRIRISFLGLLFGRQMLRLFLGHVSEVAVAFVPKSGTPLTRCRSHTSSCKVPALHVATQGVDEEKAFLDRCKQLCEERNLGFEKIKNARDLASVQNSPIRPGRIFRTGRLSDATDADIALLKKLNFRTLVDLRSPTELKDDVTLLREEVFDEFTDMVWREQGRRKDGCLKELKKGEFPIKKHFWNRQNMHNGEK